MYRTFVYVYIYIYVYTYPDLRYRQMVSPPGHNEETQNSHRVPAENPRSELAEWTATSASGYGHMAALRQGKNRRVQVPVVAVVALKFQDEIPMG